jgi:hypothetical protein
MEFKGTKGDLRANGLHIQQFVDGKFNKMVGQCYLMGLRHNLKGRQIKEVEGEANALLYSKAPQMLEKLQEIVENWKSGNEDNFIMANLIDDAEQLIKEATELK